MSGDRHWLVFTARLRPGMRERARELIEQGPPLPLEESGFDAHEIFLSNEDVIFVFEGRREHPSLRVRADNPRLVPALQAWDDLLEGMPLPAETVFSWLRGR